MTKQKKIKTKVKKKIPKKSKVKRNKVTKDIKDVELHAKARRTTTTTTATRQRLIDTNHQREREDHQKCIYM